MLTRTLLSAILATTTLSAFAANYFVVVPVKGRTSSAPVVDVAVTLNAATLPTGIVGQPYVGFNLVSALQVTGDASYTSSGVSWTVLSGALPSGLSLGADGVISGTPTQAGTSEFSLKATYKTKSGQQAYQFVVGQVSVSLAPVSGYSTNFGSVFVNKSAVQRFSYTNTGALPVTGVTSQVTGSAFASISATTCGAILAPTASCSIDVTYTPSVADTLAAQLSIRNAEQVSPATLGLTGVGSNVLYSQGTPTSPVFIKTTAGTGGSFLGAQASTTQLPQITTALIGGAAIWQATPFAFQQISLQSSTATTATYVMGVRDSGGPTPHYTKMVQVVLTLSGTNVYATLATARYHTTALTTGSSSNLLTLWNTGTAWTTATDSGTSGYGVAGMTVIGF